MAEASRSAYLTSDDLQLAFGSVLLLLVGRSGQPDEFELQEFSVELLPSQVSMRDFVTPHVVLFLFFLAEVFV